MKEFTEKQAAQLSTFSVGQRWKTYVDTYTARINDDEHLDLVLARDVNQEGRIYYSLGNGQFRKGPPLWFPTSVLKVWMMDWTEDNLEDLVALTPTGLLVYPGREGTSPRITRTPSKQTLPSRIRKVTDGVKVNHGLVIASRSGIFYLDPSRSTDRLPQIYDRPTTTVVAGNFTSDTRPDIATVTEGTIRIFTSQTGKPYNYEPNFRVQVPEGSSEPILAGVDFDHQGPSSLVMARGNTLYGISSETTEKIHRVARFDSKIHNLTVPESIDQQSYQLFIVTKKEIKILNRAKKGFVLTGLGELSSNVTDATVANFVVDHSFEPVVTYNGGRVKLLDWAE